MSGLHDGAPDPLASLRATDRRPRSEVLRERVFADGSAWITAVGGRLAVAALVCVLAVGVGWRLFVESEPPVEESIPFATGATPEPASVDPSAAAGSGEDPTATAATADVTDTPDALVATEVNVDAPEQVEAVVVHVAGAVSQPGLVRGDSSWRIDDALNAAGGPVATADIDRINLAAPILDGQRIFVPFVNEVVPTVVEPQSPVSGTGDGATSSSARVDLNSSDALELQRLPGVGPATAAAIVSHREDFGSFGTVDALVAVPGIGPATLEALRDHVFV